MYQLSETTFISTNTKTHGGIIKCADGNDGDFSASQLAQITLRPGCTAFTATHTAATSMDIAASAEPTVYEHLGDVLAFFGAKPLHDFLNTSDFDSTPIDPPNTLNLDEWNKMKSDRESHALLGHSATIFAVIATVLVIGVIVFLVIKCCKKCRPQLAQSQAPGVQMTVYTTSDPPPAYCSEENRPIIRTGRNNSQATAPPAYSLRA